MENRKKPSKWKIILGTVLLFIVLFTALSIGTEAVSENQMDAINSQVAEDAVRQYEIAKKGDAMDAYTQASFVWAAYLQAKDQENYKKWKEIEKKEAKAAGISGM